MFENMSDVREVGTGRIGALILNEEHSLKRGHVAVTWADEGCKQLHHVLPETLKAGVDGECSAIVRAAHEAGNS